MKSIFATIWTYFEGGASSIGTSVLGMFQIFIVAAVLLAGDPTMTSLAVGGALAVVGIALRVWAVGYGAKAGVFVLKGPYLFVRHPFFLGTILLYAGMCFAGRNVWVTIASLVLLVFVIGRKLEEEEMKISQTLGFEYTNYQASVPPFFPRLFPFGPEVIVGGDEFSLRKALTQNSQSEVATIVLVAMVLASLYALTLPMVFDWFKIAVVAAVALFIVIRFIYFRRYYQQN